jgi:hypothetical protein
MGRLGGMFDRQNASTSRLWHKLMSDVTGLDIKGTLEAFFLFAIAIEMYSRVGHIIKYVSPQN